MNEEDIKEIQRLAGVGSEEELDLRTVLNTQKYVLGGIIPQLREIAKWGTKDPESRKKLMDIADRLASMQWKLHGERERQSGQMWTDVERRKPLWDDQG